MEKYLDLFGDKIDPKGMERVMFFFDERLTAEKTHIQDWEGMFKGRKLKMGELFKRS